MLSRNWARIGVVQLRKLEIHDEQVQVWSGEAPLAWAAVPRSRAALKTRVNLDGGWPFSELSRPTPAMRSR